jgi:hypothetical protein
MPLRKPPPISSRESASYSSDLIGELQEMALHQNQGRLASLLEAARAEAERLAHGRGETPHQ